MYIGGVETNRDLVPTERYKNFSLSRIVKLELASLLDRLKVFVQCAWVKLVDFLSQLVA